MAEGPTVCLPDRQLFEIPDAASARILCTAGCLWLTLDGDRRDVILRAGDSFEAEAPRRALLYAVGPSAFVLAPRTPRLAGAASGRDTQGGRAPVVWAATRAARAG